MNPNQQDNFMFWGITLIFFIAVLCAVILNPLHKKNIEKLKSPTYSTVPWEPEYKGQEYTLQHGD